MFKYFSIKFTFLLMAILCTAQSIDDSFNPSNEKPPMMGWASWNHYRININDSIIKSQADALVNHNLVEFGYNYINIDDGYFGGRDDNGKIITHKVRFPDGMKTISKYIHSKGLKAGIYTDAGINTCASYWDKDTFGAGMGLFGYDQQDLKTFLVDWDFDFIKVDWCGGDWLGLNDETRYKDIKRKLLNIKPKTGYNVCRWKFPGEWVTAIADSWRISSDLDNHFNSILNAIDQNADLWKYASYGHYNDMDMLQVGRGMTYVEDKTHFTMWCLMHSPLVLGNDLNSLTEETKSIITNRDLIEINQSKYVYQARRIIDYGDLEVWAKPLISTISGQVVVALLNRSEQIKNIDFKLKTVGVNSEKCYSTKDLWTKEIISNKCDSAITRQVPAHGIVVLKITGESLPYNVFQFKDDIDPKFIIQ